MIPEMFIDVKANGSWHFLVMCSHVWTLKKRFQKVCGRLKIWTSQSIWHEELKPIFRKTHFVLLCYHGTSPRIFKKVNDRLITQIVKNKNRLNYQIKIKDKIFFFIAVILTNWLKVLICCLFPTNNTILD